MSKIYVKVVFKKHAKATECVKLIEELQESPLVKNVEVYMEVKDGTIQRSTECHWQKVNDMVH